MLFLDLTRVITQDFQNLIFFRISSIKTINALLVLCFSLNISKNYSKVTQLPGLDQAMPIVLKPLACDHNNTTNHVKVCGCWSFRVEYIFFGFAIFVGLDSIFFTILKCKFWGREG